MPKLTHWTSYPPPQPARPDAATATLHQPLLIVGGDTGSSDVSFAFSVLVDSPTSMPP